MQIRLPRLLTVPGRATPLRLYVQTELTWPGPVAHGIRLDSQGVGDPAAVIAAASVADHRDPALLGLHTLATAVRARKLFAELVRIPVRWPGFKVLYMQPLLREVKALEAPFAAYLAGGFVAFNHVRNGPFACASHDVVVHETAHALLHATLQWFDADAATRAATEALGDFLAMVSAARHTELRSAVIAEAGGSLRGASTAISRFGEAADGGVIRDAAVRTIAGSVPDPHRDANSFTSALYECIARIADSADDGLTEESLTHAVDEVANVVFAAAELLPRVRCSLHALAIQVCRLAIAPLRDHLAEAFENRAIATDLDGEDVEVLNALPKQPPPLAAKSRLEDWISAGLGSEVTVSEILRLKRSTRARYPRETKTVVVGTVEGTSFSLGLGPGGRPESCLRSSALA